MPGRLLPFVLLALALAACGGEDGPQLLISTGDEEVEIDVEVADEPGERERGLMGRESLDPDAGMVFLWPEERKGAFWMKNTLIPLSIAFYDRSGRILRILDMVPCRADPCPLYDPEVAYRGALEVNRGAFSRWGVAPGDTVSLRQ